MARSGEGIDGVGTMTLFCLLLPILSNLEMASGKVLEETYLKWIQYKEECIKMIEYEPFHQGLFCNRTFDRYACWPDTPAGTVVNISCPHYLPWFDEVSQGVVRRECGVDGHWVQEEDGQVWRDMSQCEEEQEVASRELWVKQLMESFRMLYTVGYSLSLFTLIMALIILLSIRKLHCTRNYIHANLFMSFILRAVSVIVKDTMLERHWGREIMRQADLNEMLSHQAAIGCRVAQVMMQYCVLANHYWFFGEAIYLYSVLIASVFIEDSKYLPYLCLGWGTPLLFVIPWAVAKLLKENRECWAVNENMYYWWIIRFPILFASLINLMIFMKILKVIISKLRASNQNGYPDYKLRLAKATLTLIPLFGIHEVIFIFATDEQTTGILRYIKVFFTLFLNSFQGFLVAVLYCYSNKELSIINVDDDSCSHGREGSASGAGATSRGCGGRCGRPDTGEDRADEKAAYLEDGDGVGMLWTVTNRIGIQSRDFLHRRCAGAQHILHPVNKSPA